MGKREKLAKAIRERISRGRIWKVSGGHLCRAGLVGITVVFL